MWNSVFNPQNSFFQSMDKLFNLVLLSVLWALLCIPIITIGPATAALYYTLVKCVRRGESEPFRNFFQSFHTNFKIGAVTGIICTTVALVLYVGFGVLEDAARPGNQGATVMLTVYAVVTLLLLGVFAYLFPLLSRYSFTLSRLILTAGQLALRHLPTTIFLALLLGGSVFLSLQFLFPILLMPAVTGLICSLPLEPIFRRYTADGIGQEEEKPWYLR